MTNQDHDEDGRELWHAVVMGLAIEALAVTLFFACAFVWFGILSGRI
jgi:hypothetical protein